jgi:hypothetical protein
MTEDSQSGLKNGRKRYKTVRNSQILAEADHVYDKGSAMAYHLLALHPSDDSCTMNRV